MREMQVQSLGQKDPLEEEMATHSSILAWRIRWIKEPGGLQSMGLQSRTRLSDFTHFPLEIKEHDNQIQVRTGKGNSSSSDNGGLAESRSFPRTCIPSTLGAHDSVF